MSPKTDTQKSAKNATVTGKPVKGFTDEERAAMKARAQELKAEARLGPHAKKADGEKDVLAKKPTVVRDGKDIVVDRVPDAVRGAMYDAIGFGKKK